MIDSLREVNAELIANLDAVSKTLSKMSLVYKSIIEQYNATNASNLANVFSSLETTFNKCIYPCNQLKESFRINFDDPLRYYIKELINFDEYMNKIMVKRVKYLDMKKKWKAKKTKYFEEKRIDTWKMNADCPYSREALIANKQIAFSVMFPNDTQELANALNEFGYFMNKSNEEYERLCHKNYLQFKNQFTEAPIINSNILTEVNYIKNR